MGRAMDTSTSSPRGERIITSQISVVHEHEYGDVVEDLHGHLMPPAKPGSPPTKQQFHVPPPVSDSYHFDS